MEFAYVLITFVASYLLGRYFIGPAWETYKDNRLGRKSKIQSETNTLLEFVKALYVTTHAIEDHNKLNEQGANPDSSAISDSIANLMALYANEVSKEKNAISDLTSLHDRRDTLLDILRGICIEKTGDKLIGEKLAVEKIDFALMELDAQDKLINPGKVENPARIYFSA